MYKSIFQQYNFRREKEVKGREKIQLSRERVLNNGLNQLKLRR
jgi:hypothetical protein